MYGAVRGRGLVTPSYSIYQEDLMIVVFTNKARMPVFSNMG